MIEEITVAWKVDPRYWLNEKMKERKSTHHVERKRGTEVDNELGTIGLEVRAPKIGGSGHCCCTRFIQYFKEVNARISSCFLKSCTLSVGERSWNGED